MNLYLVISEELETSRDRLGYYESYRIAELVLANSYSQARWLAWKNDKDSFSGCMLDMPRFTTRLKVKDVPESEAGIATHNAAFHNEDGSWLWEIKEGEFYP